MAFLSASAAAEAKVTVGIGQQDARMFDSPLWQALKLKKVRYLVPWNVVSTPDQMAEVVGFMTKARSVNQQVLVTFTATRGCFINGKYAKRKKLCKLPTVKQYTKAVKAFHRTFPFVKEYAAWNEANHVSQPTYKNPKRAAQYYLAFKKKVCKKCKVIAGDLLDSSNLRAYALKMRKVKGMKRAKLWGLHNYTDSNRRRSRGTSAMLRTVPGEVWVTETGGISIFTGSNLRPNAQTAVKAMKYLFSLAKKFGKKRRGMKSKITRLYPYDFGPSAPNMRFDASLLNPDGTPRPVFLAFAALASKAKK
ncbi:MAG TPA: hypothetical protein VF533_09970 [Solirubrobacteraceae bacterium]